MGINPTKSYSHLTLQVARDPAALELDHPEHTAGVALLGVVVQLGDAPHLLKEQQNTFIYVK